MQQMLAPKLVNKQLLEKKLNELKNSNEKFKHSVSNCDLTF